MNKQRQAKMLMREKLVRYRRGELGHQKYITDAIKEAEENKRWNSGYDPYNDVSDPTVRNRPAKGFKLGYSLGEY